MPSPLPCAVLLAAVIALCGRPPRTLPAGARADDRIDDRLVGTVGAPVIPTAHGFGAPLEVGRTVVWLWTERALAPGQRVAVTGRLRTPRGFLAPGSPDRATLAASRGAAWELDVRAVEVLADEPDVAARVWRWAHDVQRTLAARVPGDDAASAALRGIVTGDRSRIPPQLDERWRIAGIYHVLSVSGLHLAALAGLAFALLRRLVAASPWGGRTRPARWAAPIALVLAIAYTLVTGAQLATLRALAVVTIVLVAQMLDRPVRLVDALGVAAIAILAWRPQDVHDPSFQLSFVAALTLALRPTVPPGPRRRLVHRLARGFATSAWVAITTAPITALHFHQVAAGGVIGNLVLTPLVELIALPVGLAGTLIGAPGGVLVDLAVALVAAVDAATAALAHVLPVGAIAISSSVFAGVLVGGALWLSARPRRTRHDLLVWAAVCATWALARTPAPVGALRVTFLDVGQGDAALVELPGGGVWLVDAGGHASARELVAASAPGRAIDRALAVYGHRAIDLAIISHPHPDHYLGLAALTVPVRELWIADAAPGHGPTSFSAVAGALARRGTQIAQPQLGTARSEDGVELVVWAPRYRASSEAHEVLAPDPVRTVNDNSLVVELRYAGRSVVFLGDLEAEGEEALVAAGIGRADVVKVAHHGSPTSSTEALVLATHPSLAVISCGVANTFGFPAAPVIARWRAAGAEVARTDRDGTITVTVHAGGKLVVERFARPGP